eukprot:CAMPEP_0172430378 /NCGR_PEP_ID=MMETSP1064-20121228/54192_1 /TAXON_ID=202472 /ORGANISM="Aulacoseira subarctica , Strain CCAP 1002/5" /LENGTH=341 /DNA_ID=CAMNT_0013176375 /DNA_START=1 /DNA_END=1026 /DNA_ORIENTATION=+
MFSLLMMVLMASIVHSFHTNNAFFLKSQGVSLFRTKKLMRELLFSSSNSNDRMPRHDVRGNDDTVSVDMDPEEEKIQRIFMEHQQKAPKLGFATDVRTLVQYNHGFAVLSTNSKSNPGFPGGSVVGFAPDEEGRPLFVFSGMSSHTQDLLADPRCSITIASKEFKGAADGRVNIMGQCKLIAKKDVTQDIKAAYLKKHPNAFWINFGDFNWFRLEDIQAIRFVGGFARAGQISPKEYKEAQPDPISEFGPHIAKHMNEDHMDSTIAMIRHYIPGMDVTEAIITSVDSLGMYIKVKRTPRASDQFQEFKLRLPFPRPANDRKDVKNLIVEMTTESSATSSAK